MSQTSITKLENIQRITVKWILSEEEHHYNELEYVKRLKDLDLLPLISKFEYSDLLVFHKVYHKQSVIEMPDYLKALTEHDISRLRSVINPPYHLSGHSGSKKVSSIRSNKLYRLSLKCTAEASSPAFKSSFFFRTHLLWNLLPTDIKELSTVNEFASKLKLHMWDIILDPH